MGRLSRSKLRKRLALQATRLRHLSPRVAAEAQDALGQTLHALGGLAAQRRILEPLHRWRTVLGADWDVPATARLMAGRELRWLTRDLVIDGASDRWFDRLVRVTHRERLDEALASRRGVILLLSHFGSHMLPAHWAVRTGVPFRVYMERPNTISRLLASHFSGRGELSQADLFISRREASPAEAARSVIRAVQILKAGMVLGIAGDVRWSGAHTAEARFLGCRQTFTSTWVALAALTGAAVVPCFAHLDDHGAFTLDFEEPMPVPRGAAAPALVQAHLNRIENRILADPASAIEYLSWPELRLFSDAAERSPAAGQAA